MEDVPLDPTWSDDVKQLHREHQQFVNRSIAPHVHSWYWQRLGFLTFRMKAYAPQAKSVLDIGCAQLLTGYLNDAEVAACMRASAAFVMASHYEGFGLPILEAAGKAKILLANTAIFREVASYLDHASLIDFGDPEQAARAIAEALGTPLAVSEVSPSAAAELTWEHAAERYASLFLRLAHECPKP